MSSHIIYIWRGGECRGNTCLPYINVTHMHRDRTHSPVCAAVSALGVSEVRLQEHVLIDPSNQAVHVRGHLLLTLHQGQHYVQSLLSVAR